MIQNDPYNDPKVQFKISMGRSTIKKDRMLKIVDFK